MKHRWIPIIWAVIVHEALAARFQKPVKLRSPEPSEQSLLLRAKAIDHRSVDETPVDTDHLGTIVHEALAARFQKPVFVKSNVEDDQDVFLPEYPTSFEQPTPESESDLIRSDDTRDRFESASREESFDPPLDETMNEMETSETITYEIESSLALPRRSLQDSSATASSRPQVGNLSQIISGTLLASSNYQRDESPPGRSSSLRLNIARPPLYDEEIYEEYGYRRTTTDGQSDDVVEKFEELCRRYSNSLEQYQSTTGKIDDDINQFERQFNRPQDESAHTPTSETTSEELITTIERVIDMHDEEPRSHRHATDNYSSTLSVERQPNRLGSYGFDLKETGESKIQIAAVTNASYYPHLMVDDELVSVNHNRSFQSLDECQDLLESLWREHSEYVQITIIKTGHIPILPSK